MRALVFEKPDVVHYVTNHPIPELNYGEALIQVGSCGICGTCIHVFRGEHKTATYPIIAGHEFFGRLVAAKGTLPDHLSINDLVAVQPIVSCGYCSSCQKGYSNICEHLKIIGVHENGGYADYVKAPIQRLFHLSERIDQTLAPLIEPLAVAIHDVRCSGLQRLENIIIFGAGPIGILLAIVARYFGALNVVISEVNSYRTRLAESMGFHVHNPDYSTLEDVMRQLSINGFDIAFDAAGFPSALNDCIHILKPAGRVVAVAISPGDIPIDGQSMFFGELKVIGVRLHSRDDFAAAVRLIESGVLNTCLKALITDCIDITEGADAFQRIQHRTDVMKTIIRINEMQRL